MMVISLEYPGYSVYEGTPSADRVVSDAIYVYDFLTKLLGIGNESIFVVGRSLGTFVASSLAANRPVRALALISPFVSIKVDYSHRACIRDSFGNYRQSGCDGH